MDDTEAMMDDMEAMMNEEPEDNEKVAVAAVEEEEE